MEKNSVDTKKFALDFVENGEEALLIQKPGLLPENINYFMLIKDVLVLSIPALIELGLTQLTSMVDLMMVGKLGTWALSAVGLATHPRLLLMMTVTSLNYGTTALIARYKGAGMYERANRVMHQALRVTVLLSVVSSVIGYLFAEDMIRLMGATSKEALEGGTVYLQIQMVGFLAIGITTTVTAALRAVGDSRTAMVYNVISNLVNILFNYLLIYGKFGFPELGVAGASWATVLGQCVAFLIACRVLMRKGGYLVFCFRDLLARGNSEAGNIFRVGMPAALEQLAMRIGMIAFSVIIATLGETSYATHQACMNVLTMSYMIGQAFAVSSTTMVGQSLGKVRSDMAVFYCRASSMIGVLASGTLAFIMLCFGREIMTLYSSDPQIIDCGAYIMKVVALIQPFQGIQFILAGGLRGAGDTKSTALVSVVTIFFLRPVLAAILVFGFDMGIKGAWYAYMADQITRSLLIYLRYMQGKWKVIRFNV